MNDPGAFWGVVRTQPNREAAAQRFLRLAGYATYVPRLRGHRLRGGRKVERVEVLFPNYAFIEIRNGQWWNARWTVGVVDLLRVGDQPARIDDRVNDELRSRERKGLIDPPRSRLRPGTRVKVLAGPLAGQIGVLGALRGHERVLVLMTWLGRVELAKKVVEAID
jgi:transcriptional antiterminator RfaH